MAAPYSADARGLLESVEEKIRDADRYVVELCGRWTVRKERCSMEIKSRIPLPVTPITPYTHIITSTFEIISLSGCLFPVGYYHVGVRVEFHPE